MIGRENGREKNPERENITGWNYITGKRDARRDVKIEGIVGILIKSIFNVDIFAEGIFPHSVNA